MLSGFILGITLLALASPSSSPGAPASDVPAYWRTRAEKTGFRETADYEETMRYCRQLEAASGLVRLVTYGTSGQGRALPLMILSKDGAFTPEQAKATGKPIVLIQNGIHSGEIEGKDACLALMRDMVVIKTRAALLDHAIVLVLPIFSVDAHERRSRYSRINQNGPELMGWRTTPIGLNLNRDYLKAETPEMRALLSQVFTRWWPDLLVDDHTTDGADYRHDVTYAFNSGPGVPRPIARWVREAFEGRVVPRLAAMKHLPAPYLDFREGGDPRSGLDFGDLPPRFSTGYAPLQCRPGILVETHMRKPYATRVRATYDLLVALLEEVNARPRALLDAVAAAESEVAGRARLSGPAGREVVLAGANTDSIVPFDFKGVATRWETSDLTGGRVARYGAAPWDTVIWIRREQRPVLTVEEPAGYLIPQEWTIVADRLAVHGVRFRRLAREWRDTVEVQHILEWNGRAAPSEGHHPISVTRVALERRLRSFHPGDLWVPLDQRGALVAIHLLEAQSPDGLLYWNAFDTVLERKEYAEAYVMEPIARDMLKQDHALAEEFQARVRSDTAFAKNPQARLDFFYRRSLWADPEQDLDPAVRALRPPPESVLAR